MFKKLKKKKNNKGFTLVELLVVIAIIGILSVVAVPSLFKNVDKAKATQVVTNVKALKTEILTEYANSNVDANLLTSNASGAFTTTKITKLLELDTNNKGNLGETYAVIDDGSNVEGAVKIQITCSDNEKAKIVGQQLGVTVGDTGTTVDYPVGKK